LPTNGGRKSVDRRSAQRFPISFDIQYRILGLGSQELRSGKTVNMSSSGMLLVADGILLPGLKIEVLVNWPVKLNDRVRLRLIVFGKVVRVDTEGVAVMIQRYEFRTLAP
jgi:c-di-GMP-binding flagellar brake protein YcgR